MTSLNTPDDDDIPSKTRRKQHSHELQQLGKALADWPRNRLKQLELPENLLIALVERQRITAHEGARRQLQLIGKLMRQLSDEQCAQIRERLNSDSLHTQAENAQFHRLERWRERLLENDEVATEWMNHYPHTDAQQLRALIRQARKEREQIKTPRAFRELFQYLKQLAQ